MISPFSLLGGGKSNPQPGAEDSHGWNSPADRTPMLALVLATVVLLAGAALITHRFRPLWWWRARRAIRRLPEATHRHRDRQL